VSRGLPPSFKFERELRALPVAESASALAAALDVADAREIGALARALADLIARLAAGPAPAPPRVWRLWGPSARDPREDALAWTICLRAAASVWQSIPREARNAITVAARGRWAHALTPLPPPSNEAARRSILDLAAETADPSAFPALVDLLEDPRTDLATDAEEAIARAVRTALNERADVAGQHQMRSALRAELTRAISRIDVHSCRGVLASAIQLLEPDLVSRVRRGLAKDPLAVWFLEATAERTSPLAPSLRASRGSITRTRAWEWLPIDTLTEPALARLARSATPSEHAEVLGRWHLALRPARAARLGAGARLVPEPGIAASLPEDARVGAVRLQDFTRAPDVSTPEWALCDPDERVRLTATREAGAAEAADFVFDASPAIARSAMLAWSVTGVRIGRRRPAPGGSALARSRFASRVTRSPHAAVRRIAAADAALADAFDGSSELSRSTAWALLREDREAFIDQLRSKLTAPGPQVVPALLLVRRLGIAAELTRELLALAATGSEAAPASAEARAGATAVAVVSSVRDPRASDVLGATLTAADPRVRANSVEAIAVRIRHGIDVTTSRLPSLVELKGDREHRVRANAIRAMAECAVGAAAAAREALSDMLEDARPMHRLAGVWAAEKTARLLTPSGGIPARITTLASEDAEPFVRSRAEACARLLGLRAALAGSDELTEVAA
jgi:hypothetical protein